jgi:diguanylate cyclase (GGDEF)-like protein
LVGGVVGYRSLIWKDGTARQVLSAEEVISRARGILSLAIEAENGERGFLLTGNESFLEPYAASHPRIGEELAELELMVAGDPDQSLRVRGIRGGFQQWRQEAAEPQIARRMRAAGGLPDEGGWRQDKRLMDDLRRKVDALISAERHTLEARQIGHVRAGDVNQILSVVVPLVIALAVLALTGLLSRHISGSTESLVEAAAAMAGGDLARRAEIYSGDELQEIAAAFNSMAEKLAVRAQDEARVNAALAMNSATLEDRTQEMNLLGEMGELLQVCRQTVEAYPVITRSILLLLPEWAGAISTTNPSRSHVELSAVWGGYPGEPGQDQFEPHDCWALRRGGAHVVQRHTVRGTRTTYQGTDVPDYSGLHCNHMRPPWPSSSICFPLIAQGEVLGVLSLRPAREDEAGQEPPKVNMKLLQTIADRVSLALGNLKLREILRNQSIRDSLTGLFNRRYLDELICRELRGAARHNREFGVIMIDIDHFKQFNDSFGHEAGDVLLQAIGGFLQSQIRGEDTACRYGGEEFCVLLSEAPLEVTRRRGEDLREGVRQIKVRHLGRALGELSISLGVAEYPYHGASAAQLLLAADHALYRAKLEGRNRVVVAETTAPPAELIRPRAQVASESGSS